MLLKSEQIPRFQDSKFPERDWSAIFGQIWSRFSDSQIPRFRCHDRGRQIPTFHGSQIPRSASWRARVTCFRSCEESRIQNPESQDGGHCRQPQSRITESHIPESKAHECRSAQFERIQNPESSVELSVSVKIQSAESRSASWGVSALK